MATSKDKQKIISIPIKTGDSSEEDQNCGSCLYMVGKDGKRIEMATDCMTNRELQILAEMRAARKKGEEVKKYLKEIDKSLESISKYSYPPDGHGESDQIDALLGAREEKRLGDERQRLYFWLTKLRQEWKELDHQRVLAAEERMRLLGHID